MTIDLLTKLYIKWCEKEKFTEILSADEMYLTNQIKHPYQYSWLIRFGVLWDKLEEKGYQQYIERKNNV